MSGVEIARLRAAVERLADTIEGDSGVAHNYGCAGEPDCLACIVGDLRALAAVHPSGEAWDPASWCRHPNCRDTNWCGTGRVHMRDPECPPDPGGKYLDRRPEDGPPATPSPVPPMPRPFELHRDTDVSGVSGTGVVAEGVAFSDGTVALRWLSDWPTSVVFHDRGVEAVEAIHGHGGATRIVWADGGAA
jgi:hypothetical protein